MAAPATPVNKATHSVGFVAKFVQVTAITQDGLSALTVDRQYTETRVPMLVQRAKAILPKVGETWLIDQAMGFWTFAAFVGTSLGDFPSGGGTGGEPAADQHVYVQAFAPTAPNPEDLWIDTALGDQLSIFRNHAWQVLQWGTESIANLSITVDKIALGSITTNQIAPHAGITKEQVAFQIGDSGTTVFTVPEPSGMNPGDVWINPTDGNAVYVWDGAAWNILQWGTDAYADASITQAKLGTLVPNAVVIGGASPSSSLAQVSGLGTSGEVLTSNGLSAPPSWQPGGGGGGGTGLPPVGSAATYTFAPGDLSAPASWYGGVAVKVLATWTPAISGTLALVPPSNNSDPDYTSFAYYVWHGTVANTDYPDATAGSGSFTGGIVNAVYGGVSPPAPTLFVTAGQSYTVILVDWSGSSGGVMELDGLLNSLYPFSGIQGPVTQIPPAMPPGWAATITLLPDGSALCRRPVILENKYSTTSGNFQLGAGHGGWAFGGAAAATGDAAFAETQGTASGKGAHAENLGTASGESSHAESAGTASGYRSHAEGDTTLASGSASHAQGANTIASSDYTHAAGSSGVADRITGEALGAGTLAGGTFGTPNPKRIQTSRFSLGTQTTDASSHPLLLDVAPGPFGISLTLTDNFLTLIKGWICATDTAGAAAKAWEISMLVDMASGTPRLVGSASKSVLAADAGASTWDVTLTAAASDPVKVTGQAATTINWSAHLLLVESPNP